MEHPVVWVSDIGGSVGTVVWKSGAVGTVVWVSDIGGAVGTVVWESDIAGAV